MLERFRQNQTGAKVILGGLAAMFILWGVGGVGFESGPEVVAEVYDHAITRRDLDREAALLRRRYDEIFRGASLPASFDVTGQALDQLVDGALLEAEAARLGLLPTESDVLAEIMAMPELQENGRFSKDILERYLRAARDRGEFEREVKERILRDRFESLASDGVDVTDAEVAERFRFDREQVDLEFVRVAANDLLQAVTVTDADLEAHRTANEQRYRTPERLRVRYVTYTPDEFAAQAAPTAEAVAAYYEDHKDDRFTEQEQVHARHILVKTSPDSDDAAKTTARKKAEDLLAKAKGGADFAKLATSSSDDPGSASKGGDLGFFPRGRMVPAFDAAAFALEPGQLSDVIESPFGFHVIKLEEKRPGGTKPLEAVQADVTKILTDERALELARMQADSDRRTIVKGTAFAEAIGKRTPKETEAFAAADPIPGIGRVKAFSDAAFALDAGEVSDIVDGERAVYILQAIERVAPAVPPLADIRTRVEADARREKATALAKEKAEALRTAAKDHGLAKAAADAKLALDQTGNFERRATSVPKLGAAADLRADAFRLTIDTPLAGKVYTIGDDAVVVALKARTLADESLLATEKGTLESSLLQQKRAGLMTSFMSDLKERARKAGALRVRADVLPKG